MSNFYTEEDKPTDQDIMDFDRSKDFVFLPPRAVKVAVEEYTEIATTPAILTWGLPKIDAKVNPFQRTTYTALLARPGMGKTYELMRLANVHRQQLHRANRGNSKPPLVMYATWETSVEEFIAVYGATHTGVTLADIGRGKADLKKLRNDLVMVMGDNFCVFGVSHVEARKKMRSQMGKGSFKLPMLPTLNELYQGITYLEGMGHRIGALYVDYIQAIPDNNGRVDMRDVTARVSENIVQLKTIFCVSLGIPTFVGVQARREVDEYGGLKLPKITDGQHTSVIEQSFDRVLGLTMPAKYMPCGDTFYLGDENGTLWGYPVEPDSRVITLLKQRYGSADKNDTWATNFNHVSLQAKLQQTTGEKEAEPDDLGPENNVPTRRDFSAKLKRKT